LILVLRGDAMYVELVARLGVAALAGALLGAEREWGRHNAGFRTHLLVSLGACLFTLLGVYGFQDLPNGTPLDPSRITAQVVSGIGFIGAGAILRDGVSVRGLTTAATLWVSAALGAAAGAGLYGAILITLGMALTALTAVRGLRGWHPGRLLRRSTVIVVEYSRGHGTLGPLTRGLRESGAVVRLLSVDDRHGGGLDGATQTIRRVEMRVQPGSRASLARVLDTIRRRPEVRALSADGRP
jgi:putative Mg2+ transporter-C (MgtC) family protein